MAVPKMEFLVSDAERLFAEGGKVKHLSFWSYKIMCRTQQTSYQSPPLFPKLNRDPPRNFIQGSDHMDYCTWHRYSDFAWLVEYLAKDFMGLVFPPIPDKDADGTVDKLHDLVSNKDVETSKDNPMVQMRMRRLQLFFDHLAKMFDVYESNHMKAFLTMEEPEWLAYKKTVENQGKPQGWDAFKAKGASLIDSVQRATERKVNTFDTTTPIGKCRDCESQLAGSLFASMRQLMNVAKFGQHEPKSLCAVDEVYQVNRLRPIPLPLCYNGHFVQDANDQRNYGSVRHVDGNNVWVEIQGGEGKLTHFSIENLRYPESGLTDPASFAINELLLQLDSFFMYLCFRNESKELECLIDLVWFWMKYAREVVKVVDSLEAVENERLFLEAAGQKKSDLSKKAALLEKSKELRGKFVAGCQRFENCYGFFFRPLQKQALHLMTVNFGNLSHSFLTDQEWEHRLQRADSTLPLKFDVPPELAGDIAKLRQEEQQLLSELQRNAANALSSNSASLTSPSQDPWDKFSQQQQQPQQQSQQQSQQQPQQQSQQQYQQQQSQQQPQQQCQQLPPQAPRSHPPTPVATTPNTLQPTRAPLTHDDDTAPPPPPPNNGPLSSHPEEVVVTHAPLSGVDDGWQTSSMLSRKALTATDHNANDTSEVPPPLPDYPLQ